MGEMLVERVGWEEGGRGEIGVEENGGGLGEMGVLEKADGVKGVDVHSGGDDEGEIQREGLRT